MTSSIALPAEAHATMVEWDGAALANTDGAAWSPLLLASHRAARLSVTAPCAVDATAPTKLFTTRQRPEATDGVQLVQEGAQVRLVHGGATVATQAAPAGCTVDLDVDGRRWTLSTADVVDEGVLPDVPVVSGIGRDRYATTAGGGGRFAVSVQSMPLGTSLTPLQNALRVIAAFALLVAAALVAPSGWFGRRGRWRGLVRHVEPIDVFVTVTMTAWLVVGPALYDDGWVLSTVVNGRVSGDYSSYFEAHGAILPFGWLHDSLLLLASRVSPALLWMRVPSFIAGLVAWGACRAVVRRLPRWRHAELGAAVVHLLFWCSWLNTLRPEPLVAAAGAVVLLSMHHFLERPQLRWLVAAGAVAAIASTLHPDGFVAWAPILVAVPSIFRLLRRLGAEGWLRLAAAAAGAVSLGLLALLGDGDLSSWAANRALFEGDGAHAATWRSELSRYALLFQGPYGVALRRGSVLFAGVAVVLHATRHRRGRDALLDLPAASLAVAALILLVTPSKWPWHFGALAAYAVTAVVAEIARARDDDLIREAGPWLPRRLLAIGLGIAAASVAWVGSEFWHVLALRRTTLATGSLGLLPGRPASPALWAVVLAVVATVAVLVRRGRSDLRWAEVLDTAARSFVPVLGVPLVLATIAVFAVDAVRASPGWTLGAQNIRSVTGSSCGLAEDVVTADLLAAVPLPERPSSRRDAEPPALPAGTGGALAATPDRALPGHPVVVAPRAWSSYVHGDADVGWFSSPWYSVAPSQDIGILVAGSAGSTGNVVLVEHEGAAGAGTIESAVVADSDGWAFVRLPLPAGVAAVRIVGIDRTVGRRGWLAFSGPIDAPEVRLTQLLDRADAPSVVSPQYRAYLPCIRQAAVARGVAELPDVVVSDGLNPFLPTSPFRLLPDAATLVILPAGLDGTPVEPPFQLLHVHPPER